MFARRWVRPAAPFPPQGPRGRLPPREPLTTAQYCTPGACRVIHCCPRRRHRHPARLFSCCRCRRVRQGPQQPQPTSCDSPQTRSSLTPLGCTPSLRRRQQRSLPRPWRRQARLPLMMLKRRSWALTAPPVRLTLVPWRTLPQPWVRGRKSLRGVFLVLTASPFWRAGARRL
jgi:hypothetical protein